MAILKHFCCGISLQVGTIIIGVMYLIWCLGPIATLVPTLYTEQYVYDPENQNWRVWVSDSRLDLEMGFGSGFVQAIFCVFLLFGATLEKAGMLLPWIIVETLDLIVMTAIELISCVALLAVSTMVTAVFFKGVSVALSSFLTAYCLLVVFSYYQTLRENARANVGKESVEV